MVRQSEYTVDLKKQEARVLMLYHQKGSCLRYMFVLPDLNMAQWQYRKDSGGVLSMFKVLGLNSITHKINNNKTDSTQYIYGNP